jgi:hypothetical protein
VPEFGPAYDMSYTIKDDMSFTYFLKEKIGPLPLLIKEKTVGPDTRVWVSKPTCLDHLSFLIFFKLIPLLRYFLDFLNNNYFFNYIRCLYFFTRLI